MPDPDTESDLKSDVRQQTGNTTQKALSDNALDTAYRNAIRHIRVRTGLGTNTDWFDPDHPDREEALFWFTCLFSKVSAGELDSQTVQVGAIDSQTLLAKEDNEVTVWYRNAEEALRTINSGGRYVISGPERDNRVYSGDSDASSGISADDL